MTVSLVLSQNFKFGGYSAKLVLNLSVCIQMKETCTHEFLLDEIGINRSLPGLSQPTETSLESVRI